MSGNGQQFYDPSNPNPEGGDGGGIKELRKQFKAKAKENEELKARIAALEATSRSGSVADLLANNGLDPRVAKFYPADRPTTADAVAEWVDENRDLFPQPNRQQDDPNKITLSPVEIEGYEIMRKIQAAEAATEMDFKSRLDACQNEEEVMALLQQFEQTHALR